MDAPITQARVLTREPQNELADLACDRRPPRAPPAISAVPPHKLAVSAHQRPWCHQERVPAPSRQGAAEPREQRPVRPFGLGASEFAPQDPLLVPEDQRTTISSSAQRSERRSRNELEHTPKRPVDQRTDHHIPPPGSRPTQGYWLPRRSVAIEARVGVLGTHTLSIDGTPRATIASLACWTSR